MDGDSPGRRTPALLVVAGVLMGVLSCTSKPADTPPLPVVGADALVEQTPVPADAACPAGGLRLRVGSDDDGDGVLDEGEVDDDRVVCQGEDGAAGEDGADGDAGAPGDDARPAVAGAARTRAADDNDGCSGGGVVVEVGLDVDGDGVLDDEEVDAALTLTACNGDDGDDGAPGAPGPDARGPLLRVAAAPAGACALTGVQVQGGVDDDGDGVLDDDEVDPALSVLVCSEGGGEGATGAVIDGDDAFVLVDDAGLGCPGGGTRVRVGRDKNGDGAFTDDEVDDRATRFVCEGETGTSVVPGGDPGLPLVVIDGDVTIANSLDVLLLRGIKTVRGSVEIRVVGGAPLEVGLPALREVTGGLTVVSGGAIALSLPALERVGGDVTLGQAHLSTVDLPRLASARALFLGPQLRSPATLRLPLLASLGAAPAGFEIAGPGLFVDECLTLTTLDLPLLGTAGRIELTGNRVLTVVSLPSLTRVAQSLSVDDNPALATLGLDALTVVGRDLVVTRTPSLGALPLPRLVDVGAVLQLSNLGLTRVDAPALRRVGADVELTTLLQLDDIADLESLEVVRGTLRVQNVDRLPRCAVEAVRDAVPELTGITLSGGIADVPYRGERFTGTDCRAACDDAGAGCAADASCWLDDAGAPDCVCDPGFAGDGSTCAPVSILSNASGTTLRPAADCATVLATRSPPPTGVETGVVLQPSAGVDAAPGTCDFSTHGGGWTLRTPGLERALGDAPRRYLLVAGTRSWLSPPTTLSWSFTTFRALPGRWVGFDGTAHTSLRCDTSTETGLVGLGCSTGPAGDPTAARVLAEPASADPVADEATATVRLCEGTPAVLGAPCADAQVFVRRETRVPRTARAAVCDGPGCEDDGGVCGDMLTLDDGLVEPPGPGCTGAGFSVVDGVCLRFVADVGLPGVARARCAGAGGHLVVPSTARLLLLAAGLPVTRFWTGVCQESIAGVRSLGSPSLVPLRDGVAVSASGAANNCVVAAVGVGGVALNRVPCATSTAGGFFCGFDVVDRSNAPRALRAGTARAGASTLVGGADAPTTAALDDLAVAAGFTVEAWVQPADNTTTAELVNVGWRLLLSADGRVQLDTNNGAVASFAPGTRPPAGTWSHVAVVVDAVGVGGGTARLLRDGAFVASVALATRLGSGNRVVVGPGAGGLGIDEVRLWLRARSDAEVAAGFASTVPDDAPGLVARWSFDEAAAIAADHSGNQTNLRLKNGASRFAGPPALGTAPP